MKALDDTRSPGRLIWRSYEKRFGIIDLLRRHLNLLRSNSKTTKPSLFHIAIQNNTAFRQRATMKLIEMERVITWQERQRTREKEILPRPLTKL
jgi:hypothetical protein